MEFSTPPIKPGLLKIIVTRFLMALVVLMMFFFIPAWTLNYWQAWVYLGVLLLPLVFVISFLLRHSPDLLERRMRFSEREPTQKKIILYSSLPLLLAFVIPGFDHRLGWSNPPAWLVLIADGLVLFGYGIVFWVFRENRYASRVVEVEEEQTVISSGPYAIVRHPMYVGTIIMYLFSPLALGSYWGMIPAIFTVPVLVARILNEEKVLAKELRGYTDYQQKTRYRLFPGIW